MGILSELGMVLLLVLLPRDPAEFERIFRFVLSSHLPLLSVLRTGPTGLLLTGLTMMLVWASFFSGIYLDATALISIPCPPALRSEKNI